MKWDRSTDCVFEKVHTLDTFSSFIDSLKKSRILNVGMKKVLLGIITTGKIAMYFVNFISLTSNSYKHQQNNSHYSLQCSVFISELVLALFSASICHPKRFCDFAGYHAAELFAEMSFDEYRSNLKQLALAIQFAAHNLYQNKQYIRSLPVCCLYEFVAKSTLQSIEATVDSRIIKVR